MCNTICLLTPSARYVTSYCFLQMLRITDFASGKDLLLRPEGSEMFAYMEDSGIVERLAVIEAERFIEDQRLVRAHLLPCGFSYPMTILSCCDKERVRVIQIWCTWCFAPVLPQFSKFVLYI